MILKKLSSRVFVSSILIAWRQEDTEALRDDDRYSYGFELQALHTLAAAPAEALPATVVVAAAAAVAQPALWLPPAVQLQQPEMQQPYFDKKRYLWVPLHPERVVALL